MTVAKTNRLYTKDHEPMASTHFIHTDYRYSICIQLEANVKRCLFRNIEPFSKNEIIVHFGSDKSAQATSNSFAPLCIENGNSPFNTQISELWLHPADDSHHNMQQTMDIDMFNALQLFPTFLLLVSFGKTNTGLITGCSASLLLSNSVEQDLLNETLPDFIEIGCPDHEIHALFEDE